MEPPTTIFEFDSSIPEPLEEKEEAPLQLELIRDSKYLSTGFADSAKSSDKNEPVALFLLDNQGVIMLLEGNRLENLGLNKYELVGCSLRDDIGSMPVLFTKVNDAIRSKQKVAHLEADNRDYEIHLTQIWKRNNQPSGIIGVIIDISEQKRSSQGLSVLSAYLEQLFENSPDAIAILDNRDFLVNVNKSFEKLFGYKEEEITGKNINEVLLPDNLKFEAVEIKSSIQNDKSIHLDTERMTKSNVLLEVSLLGYKIEVNNIQIGSFHIYSDISKRKKYEAEIKSSLVEKEMLLKEIHHRVKNNLQIISSLLLIQSKFLKDRETKEVFLESQNRVKSIALIHEKLYQTTNFSRIDFEKYLKTFIPHLFQTFGAPTGKISYKIKADNIFLNTETAIPCGLIINEIVTNSLKHAFKSTQKGIVSVELIYHTNNYLTLIVKDNGSGIPENIEIGKSNTLGLQLISLLTKQLGGTIELKKQNGTEFRIKFAISEYTNRQET
jgi:PAS domain S-box-containing protein